ncbi:hypothetical protein EV193_11772 [Herbihabitans rhizosphaerae]|uniref:Uncharacterized protein n=1 Tax=Herbihabitans rhizosphaerae TaxID=1872711 RepID=A0A4Q7KC38_9PSEU|nr:hypothetical protein [Herbihabitans rhizosphaerae]RZS30374.1 hypothetical protein EV193_11772 [Herbihabitans rhizosphaerae]
MSPALCIVQGAGLTGAGRGTRADADQAYSLVLRPLAPDEVRTGLPNGAR